ncbi:MAG: hypothetical protein WD872_14045, partial [Pirellulaceae bacterium]
NTRKHKKMRLSHSLGKQQPYEQKATKKTKGGICRPDPILSPPLLCSLRYLLFKNPRPSATSAPSAVLPFPCTLVPAAVHPTPKSSRDKADMK